MGFVGALVGIKSAVENSDDFLADKVPAFLPTEFITYTPLSFTDYVTAMQAKRKCVLKKGTQINNGNHGSNIEFLITGIHRNGANWQVPFVKCDSFKCEYDGQDALPFCEFGTIGVAPSSPSDSGGLARVHDFEDWLYSKYPILQTRVGLPFDFDFVRHFDSPREMDDYVKHNNYGSSTDFPKIIMGVVWEGNDTQKYFYSLRQNSTNFNAPERASRPATLTTPDTAIKFDSFARNDFEVCSPLDSTPYLGPLGRSCTGQYVYNGVLTFQRLLGDYILNRTGAAEKYKVDDGGVQFVQFPTKPYEDSGFYASIKGPYWTERYTRQSTLSMP
jgi:hypothetical protein